MMAAEKNLLKFSSILLQKGADPNYQMEVFLFPFIFLSLLILYPLFLLSLLLSRMGQQLFSLQLQRGEQK